ncbi:MAG: hypothetical protein ACI97A_000778 [Planctomycetota bacterium]|jgi:hypothetical protein
MSEESSVNTAKAPKELWIVGIVAVLWNSVGVMDFIMTNTKNATYLEDFSPEQLAFFEGYPMWVTVAWAVAVFGAVLGSVLLLMRKNLAAPVFVVALLGLLVTSFHNFVMKNGIEIMGKGAPLVTTILIMFGAVFLAYYAHAMKDKGVLR